jgi:ankyrin repeat protein
MSEKRLLSLCRKACWSKLPLSNVQQWLNQNEDNQDLLKKAANYQDEWNNTYLHYLVETKPPVDLVVSLLNLSLDKIKVKDRCLKLPLHRACDHDASLDVIKVLIEAYPEAAQVQNISGKLPLHYACMKNASHFVIQMLVEAYPAGAQVQDKNGDLPIHNALHKAFEKGRATKDIITVLLELYPNAVNVQNNNGSLPLHIACMSSIRSIELLENIQLLLETYPESKWVKDKRYHRPSLYLKKWPTFSTFLLHHAIREGFSRNLVQFLLETFPEICIERDKSGMTLLHHACTSKSLRFIQHLFTLFDAASTDSLTIQDNQGRTPLQLLKCTASTQDENERLPLHRLAATSDTLCENTLQLLIDAYPASITSVDKYGMLPFHHACINPSSSLNVLFIFLKLSPEVIGNIEKTNGKEKGKN